MCLYAVQLTKHKEYIFQILQQKSKKQLELYLTENIYNWAINQNILYNILLTGNIVSGFASSKKYSVSGSISIMAGHLFQF